VITTQEPDPNLPSTSPHIGDELDPHCLQAFRELFPWRSGETGAQIRARPSLDRGYGFDGGYDASGELRMLQQRALLRGK